jgi:hypothetical protein
MDGSTPVSSEPAAAHCTQGASACACESIVGDGSDHDCGCTALPPVAS